MPAKLFVVILTFGRSRLDAVDVENQRSLENGVISPDSVHVCGLLTSNGQTGE